jgi:hypothetical protein
MSPRRDVPGKLTFRPALKSRSDAANVLALPLAGSV